MRHCGINCWEELMKRRDVVDCRYLTSITSWNQFMLIAYTIKIKRANPAKRICLYWKTISQIFWVPDIYIFIARLSKNPKMAIYRLLSVWYCYMQISKNAEIGLFRQSQQIHAIGIRYGFVGDITRFWTHGIFAQIAVKHLFLCNSELHT